jgi:PDZ domain-containing protein
VIAAGSLIHVDYYWVRPGGALDVGTQVTISGAPSYPADGRIMLLYIKEHDDITLWEWVWASLDPDVDLVKTQQRRGDQSAELVRAASIADMATAKANARIVALDKLGYDVSVEEGVRVVSVIEGQPAAGKLQPDDVIVEINDRRIEMQDDLGEFMAAREPGDRLAVRLRRDGAEQTVTVTAGEQRADLDGDGDDESRAAIGIFTLPEYSFPIDVDIDTRNINGPSAGLAMTLALLDELSEGELTGGHDIAVTGTIAADGTVGEVGGVPHKALTAARNGAELLLVPECVSGGPDAVRSCQRENAAARERARGVEIVEVGNVDDALEALQANGGDPVPPPVNVGGLEPS